MGAARFRYALEPVALQRRWALDALLRDLGDCNVALARRRAECDAVLAQLAQAGREWTAMGQPGQVLLVDRYAMLSRYMNERQREVHALELACAELARLRDGLVDQVGAARRAVDAVEEHRGEMRREFVKARLGGEFKDADDQWSVLQTVRVTDDD
jgi:hypothetical protein